MQPAEIVKKQLRTWRASNPRRSATKAKLQSKAFQACGRRSFKAQLQSNAFTGLRPARPFSRRKRTQNALRRDARRFGVMPHRSLALLTECGPAPTRTSLCSNTGALLPHSAAMLSALYGALSHLGRTSLCYLPAFSFHPTAIIVSHRTLKPGLEARSAVTRGTAKRWNRHPTLYVFGAFLLRFLRPLRTKSFTPKTLRQELYAFPESRVPSPESRVPSPESRAMLCDECETR